MVIPMSITDVVRRKSKAKRPAVVGSMTSNASKPTTLVGVPILCSLHVYRLAPDTNLEIVLEILKPIFPQISGEQLTSRNPEIYASFKLNIYEKHLAQAMDPSIWPANACVRRFFHLPQRINNG